MVGKSLLKGPNRIFVEGNPRIGLRTRPTYKENSQDPD